jgi:hypothetical protein
LPRNAALRKELLDQTRDEPFFNDRIKHRVRHLLGGIKDEQNIGAGAAKLLVFMHEWF